MASPNKDVIIIGAGPSALTAAIYLTREDISTALYERGVVGGLAAITDQIFHPWHSNLYSRQRTECLVSLSRRLPL